MHLTGRPGGRDPGGPRRRTRARSTARTGPGSDSPTPIATAWAEADAAGAEEELRPATACTGSAGVVTCSAAGPADLDEACRAVARRGDRAPGSSCGRCTASTTAALAATLPLCRTNGLAR